MHERSKSRFRRVLFLLLSGAIIAGGAGWFLLIKPPVIRQVILISIDTCRADHLSCYGFDRPTTPHIDELAGQGVLFERAFSPAPLTLPAHCSLLTGTYPPYHQVHDNFGYKLGDSQLTLAEILKDNGFGTGAVISAFVLDEQFGMHQGFDKYYDQFDESGDSNLDAERRGEDANRLAFSFVEENQDQPFFLFLHYYDPHDAYQPPEPFASDYANDLYLGEIAYTDNCIGQLVDRLKELDMYDSTLLVIVGDHGEALGEHGESTHGYFIYQSTIQVPLIVKAPGDNRRRQRRENVSLVDVAPTILGCLDIPIPEQMQGQDLFNTSADQARSIYTESLTPTKFDCNPLLGLIDDQWSYIHTNQPELYDLAADSDELNNLAEQQNPRVRLMSENLKALTLRLAGVESRENQLTLDAESRKQLESLGYVGGVAVDDSLVIDPEKNDAKDLIECYEYREEASSLINDRKFNEAREIVDKMLSSWPEMPSVQLLAMTIFFQSDQSAKVIEHGRIYLVLDPVAKEALKQKDSRIFTSSLESVYNMMALSALKLNDYTLAIEFSNQLQQLQPESFLALNTLAQAWLGLDQNTQAIAAWAQLLKLYPDQAEVYRDVALAYYRLGDISQAVSNLKKALQLKPDITGGGVDLNTIVMVEQQLSQQISQYNFMLEGNPNEPTIHDKLARVYYQHGDYQKAINHLREAIRLKPDWAEPYMNLAGLLTTIRIAKFRNPEEAVILAQKAADLTERKNIGVLERLSVILDVAGRYDEAIQAAEDALKLPEASDNKDLVEALQKHIAQIKLKRNGVNRQG
ncbi:MAG: tetratricopeptide repeat protein [Planctomycetes bacterium]|nr:tetratricopeptide repeat protein [Planctomycetota bacterium]